MSLAMRSVLLVLACLACAGHGQKAHQWQSSAPQMHRPVDLQKRSGQENFAALLLTLNPVPAAFSPAVSGMSVRGSSRSAVKASPDEFRPGRSSQLQMIAAQDVFREYSEEASPSIFGLPVPVKALKPIQAGAITLSVVLGFAYLPSRRIWMKAVAGWLASNVGLRLSKYLANSQQMSAVPALAAELAEDFAEIPLARLEEIADKFDMSVDDVQLLKSELYLKFLEECTKSEDIDTLELKQLEELKDMLKMSETEVGTAIFKVGQQVTPAGKPKFVFLAERLLRNDTTLGYEYESARNQQELDLSKDEWLALAEKGSLPLYEKVLNSVIIEGKPCSAAQLGAVRSILGLSDESVYEKHRAVLERLMLREHSPEAVSAAQALLGWNQ